MRNNQPTAQIAVNKSVLKLYNGKVYLQNNQEFGIELFNPTTNTIAAEVWLNDKREFNSLLVLRPGQRMFLECNPETNRKFKFDTYKVEGSNDQVKEAIKNNGKVEVKFYNQKTPPIINTYVYNPPLCNPVWFPNGNIFGPIYGVNPTIGTGGNQYFVGHTLTTTGNTTSTTLNANNASFTANVGATADSVDNQTLGFLNQELSTQSVNSGKVRSRSFAKKSLNKEVETGRIEAGSASNQRFTTVDMEFEWYSFHSVAVQILPHSQKQTVEQAAPRMYCTQCGVRNRNEWKFCPKCGAKF